MPLRTSGGLHSIFADLLVTVVRFTKTFFGGDGADKNKQKCIDLDQY